MAKQQNPVRLTMRLVYAVGIGLGMAAIWWQYSEQLMARFSYLLGIGI